MINISNQDYYTPETIARDGYLMALKLGAPPDVLEALKQNHLQYCRAKNPPPYGEKMSAQKPG